MKFSLTACLNSLPYECNEIFIKPVDNRFSILVVSNLNFSISFLDLDECSVDSSRADKLFCDQNAYCYDFPAEGSYACICKDGYEGSGKVGQCKIIKDTGIYDRFMKVFYSFDR